MDTQNQILESLKKLNVEQQYKLLEFIKSINPVEKLDNKVLNSFNSKLTNKAKSKKNNPLFGMKIIYKKPFEPVSENLWEASK